MTRLAVTAATFRTRRLHLRKLEAIRAKIAGVHVKRRCDRACQTWIISYSDGQGRFNIERCDECWQGRPDAAKLTDDEAKLLPEARAELRKVRADNREVA